MSQTPDAADPVPPVPQFDRAEFDVNESGIPFCRKCKFSIPNEYYDVNGDVVCPDCHALTIRPRQRWIRALKAFILGSLAAAVGAGRLPDDHRRHGVEFLIDGDPGRLYGRPRRANRLRRSGRPVYRLLAVFLTYSAIVGMFVPDAWQAITSVPKVAREAHEAAGKRAGDDDKSRPNRSAKAKTSEDSARPKAGAQPVAVATRPAVEEKDRTKPEPTAEKDRDAKVRGRQPRGILGLLFVMSMLVLYSILLLGLIYCIPIVIGIQSPITLLIFAVGLWQAWKMNTFTEVVITGPYPVRR